MTGRRRQRRRYRPRVYLRGNLGCLGCSLPLMAALAAAVGLVLAVLA